MAYKILGIFPNITDATSFYRGMGPLAELEKSGHVQIHMTKNYDWVEMVKCHALFIQRPYKESHAEIIRLAKTIGLKVWVDYDDDLFNVPKDNPAYAMYARPEIRAAVKTCLDLADKVTVSTQALAHLKSDAIVVNNAINLKYLPFSQANAKSNYIAWRGSPTHQKDLLTYQNEIVKVSNDTESVMVFMGDYPWYIVESLQEKKALTVRGLDIFDYHKALSQKIKPKVLMVPLAFNKFNESKSNIAWLEATYAGALTVMPDMPEWQRKGAFIYKDQESFSYQLKKAFTCGESQHVEKLQESQEEIKEKYSLEKVNLLRMQIIEEIVK